MDKFDLIESWQKEEQKGMEGWDFSYLDGRIREGDLPWDYRTIVKSSLKSPMKLLDMGTGGGEFLLSLGYNPKFISVTESYPPNIELCRKKLHPLGIKVIETYDDLNLDIPSSSLDMVINRHESYVAKEVFRILKPGGIFVTQQVGAYNNLEFSNHLFAASRQVVKEYTIAYHKSEILKAGFEIDYEEEAMTDLEFLDIGGLVYFASIIDWEFPGFSVDKFTGTLLRLHRELESGKRLVSQEHRFIVKARKPLV